MKTPLESSPKRSCYIRRLKQLRRKLKQTQEEVFLGNAITMLKAREDSAAIGNLKSCLPSLNLNQGEVMELEMIINDLAKAPKANKLDLFHWFKVVWNSISIETKILLFVKLMEFSDEISSSICSYTYDYRYHIQRFSKASRII